MNNSLEMLGFDQARLDEADPSIPPECVPLRVTQVQKESYFVTDGSGDVYAEVTGRLLYGAAEAVDLPVTGDWVMGQVVDSSLAIIHKVLPRSSFLRRKTAGKKTDYQPIASNIDTALLVQAMDEDFSVRRLERYLVMVREGQIEPVILLSKSDLQKPENVAEYAESARSVSGAARVLAFSNETGEGFDGVKKLLVPSKTYCLLGSSGVGKSTLLNRLAGEELMETKEIRESDSKGRHTTTSRSLKILDNGIIMIDTPGMRELGNIGAGTGIEETFGEIHELEGLCKYSDCTHQHEDDCSILAAVESGDIADDRFESYLKMQRESAHNERSFLEKKKRDKSLGKLYKSVQKANRKNKGN
ncbi:MAG: ribosome small subunit-dependent GTPase A [Pyrinomonadaceae bacterium]|nr:ribosome small subunit-dependent GTPase A [Pyrinomonadaceae bacterium]